MIERVSRGMRVFALVSMLSAASTASLASQTPATSMGLGYPIPPVDARAAALGGVGIGLLGGTFSIRNPADLVSFGNPSLSVSAAPEAVTIRAPGGGETSSGRSRFSTIRAVLPLGQWSASVAFASELDQDWKFEMRDTLELSTGRFPFQQRRENDGGVSTIDLSVARTLGPLSLGVSYERLTGNLRQIFIRRFEISVDSTIAAPLRVDQQSNWSYAGWRLKAGLGVQISDRFRVSGAYTWSDELTAERDSLLAGGDPLTESRRFSMPASAAVGASARLFQDVVLSAGGGWKGWSDVSGDLPDGRARDVYWGGAGVEYRGIELGSFPVRVRAGGRYAELPFALEGRAAAEERAITFGFGSEFASGRAALDAALELGERGELGETGVEESFRRLTVTATIRQ